MCGIVGFCSFRGEPVDAAALVRMTNAQRHRGPDDQGRRLFSLATERSVEHLPTTPPADAADYHGAVGFNRLSILDLSPAGHQPMTLPDDSAFIVYNGEIYNAYDYREELEADGVRLRGHSDTEILLHLYRKYGMPGVLDKLNGMFAFCIVDLRERAMYLARDRMGIKPLYWSVQNGTFFFSSEVKSFLFHPRFEAALDTDHVDEYLAFRFCAEDRHLLKHVRQVRPGHWLKVDGDDVTERCYWSIPDEPVDPSITFEAATQELDERVETSVRRRLLSDVKVGCQLSGGIDSSLITAYARMHLNANLDTFSVVFQDPRFSEEPWITQAANTLHADSHRYPLHDDYFQEHFERATWFMDQPFNLPNSIGIYFLAQRARSLVTVLLSGEGADELFGGYPRFFFAAVRPGLLPYLPLLQRLPKFGRPFRNAFDDPAMSDPGEWFAANTTFVKPERLRQLRPAARIADQIALRRALYHDSEGDNVRKALKYDMRTYMVDLLMRQDRMTMAHSMENRVPFLDHHVVEFVRRLPVEHLVQTALRRRDTIMRNTKVLLKEAAARHFPREFVYRRKRGFDLPLSRYFKDQRFVQLMEERLLPGMRRRGLVEADLVERWWRTNEQQRRQTFMANDEMWAVVSLELWAQQFVDDQHPVHVDGGAPHPAAA